MKKANKVEFVALVDEVMATAIPADCKHTAAWCLAKLPSLYATYRQTNESRYADEIARWVQAVMTELTRSQVGCMEAQKIAAGMVDRFQRLHEKLSLPMLNLKAVPIHTPAKPKKVIRVKAVR
jgi:hypothetical protein